MPAASNAPRAASTSCVSSASVSRRSRAVTWRLMKLNGTNRRCSSYALLWQHAVVVSRTVIQRAIGEPLAKAGFVRVGRSSVWRRETEQLTHLMRLEMRSGAALVQWGVMSEAVIEPLFAEDPAAVSWDVAYSAMTGWLSGIPGTTLPSAVSVAGEAHEAEVRLRAVSEDAQAAASWLAKFIRRADLIDFLLEVDARTDNRGFIVPANLPLKLTVCAFLLGADGSTSTVAMAQRALTELQPFRGSARPGGIVKHREARLIALVGR
jgi:hypothetical protein